MKKLKSPHDRKRVVSISMDEDTMKKLAKVAASPSAAVLKLVREDHDRRNKLVYITDDDGTILNTRDGVVCVAAFTDDSRGGVDTSPFDGTEQKELSKILRSQESFRELGIPALEKRGYITQEITVPEGQRGTPGVYFYAAPGFSSDPIEAAESFDELISAMTKALEALTVKSKKARERFVCTNE